MLYLYISICICICVTYGAAADNSCSYKSTITYLFTGTKVQLLTYGAAADNSKPVHLVIPHRRIEKTRYGRGCVSWSSSCVRNCTVVPIKQVNWVPPSTATPCRTFPLKTHDFARSRASLLDARGKPPPPIFPRAWPSPPNFIFCASHASWIVCRKLELSVSDLLSPPLPTAFTNTPDTSSLRLQTLVA
jgi:hypothetical protein